MSLIDELNKVIYDLPFNKHHASRNEVAHFCEHNGISIRFTRARTTWHALAPCALKPWRLFLNPLLKNKRTQQNNKKDTAKNAETIEVTENA